MVHFKIAIFYDDKENFLSGMQCSVRYHETTVGNRLSRYDVIS